MPFGHRPHAAAVACVAAFVTACALALSSSAQDGLPTPPPPPPPTGTATISGSVVAADTGAPVRRARVMLFSLSLPAPAPPSAAGSSGQVTAAVTQVVAVTSVQSGGTAAASSRPMPTRIQREAESDHAGRFEFRELPAGSYSISLQSPAGFVSPRSGDVIQVDEGQATTVTLRLDRAGVIAGRVLDEDGEPVVRAQVGALRWESMGGFRRMVPAQGASTDDLGEFRLFGLRAGDYYVSASPSYRSPSVDEGTRTGLVATYFPGVPSMAGATPVTVRPGRDTAGIEFRLLTAPIASISGSIVLAGGQPLPATLRPSVTLASQVDGQRVSSPSTIRPDGTFAVADIGPGDYYLIATAFPAGPFAGGPAQTRPGAFTQVTVDGNDLTVNLELNDGATVSGRVRIEESASAPSDPLAAATGGLVRPAGGVQRAQVYASQDPTGPLGLIGSSGTRPSAVAEDGSFTLSGLRGRLRLNASGPGVLKEILLNGRDITGESLELSGTERLDGLEIVLTREIGVLQGRVVNHAGEPVPAMVVVFPDDEARLFPGSPFMRLIRTAGPSPGPTRPDAPAPRVSPLPPGSFSVGPGLVPGRYRVVAFDLATNARMPPDVETLRELAPNAARVTIEAGRTAVVELRLGARD